ncbi:hypothetical protein ABES02_28555 [Neobacillus pocheonensis]|uniref:hypothetical protein n=1 Tax=Neobacillus pocheonensis TaxID=363869 RepID=UPI003D2AEACA
MKNQKNECVSGSENWVTVISDSALECTLNATIVDNQVLFFVEDNGNLSDDFTEYEAALKAYIQVAFKRANNGFSTAKQFSPWEHEDTSQVKTLYSFVIIDEGFLQADKLLIDDNLTRLIDHAETILKDYLEQHGYSEDGLPELMTEDGYCKIVKSKSGMPCYEYEDEIWNYKFDGEETVESVIDALRKSKQ